jgi:pimeloyl-ACP methyl ester carboxylesterase
MSVRPKKPKLPLIWYIHGAASTPASFLWIKSQLYSHDAVDVSYTNKEPLADTISYLRQRASEEKRPINIIGHSLGGVIAAAIAQEIWVRRIVTMGTPFGGSMAASVMRWFMPTQLFRDISQQSPVMTNLKLKPPKTPILSFVTDSSLVVLGERTDGVVTVSSQKALKGPTYITIPCNHFEVLLSHEVVSITNDFIFKSDYAEIEAEKKLHEERKKNGWYDQQQPGYW